MFDRALIARRKEVPLHARGGALIGTSLECPIPRHILPPSSLLPWKPLTCASSRLGMVSTASRSAPEEASTCSATWSRNRRNERRQHLPWSATPHPVRQAGHETHACVNEQQKERRFKQASHEEGSLTSKPRYFLCSAALTLLPAVRCAVRCSAHPAACSALRSEVQRSPCCLQCAAQ